MTEEVIKSKIKKLSDKIKSNYAFKASFDIEEYIRASLFEKLNVSLSEASNLTFRITEKPMTLAITATVFNSGAIVQKCIIKFSFLKGSEHYENKGIYS